MFLEIGKIWAQKFRQITTVLGSANVTLFTFTEKKIPTESDALYLI